MIEAVHHHHEGPTTNTTNPESAAIDVGPSDAEVPVGVRVRAHPGLCEGWGNCHRFAPSVYPLDADGHLGVHLLEVPAGLAGEAIIGASTCPEQAITVIRPVRPIRDDP